MIITPLYMLTDEAEEIQSFSEITTGDNPVEIKNRIVDLSVYVARTGKMLADAKFHLNQKKSQETMKVIEDILLGAKLSAKVQNSLIDSICKEEQYLVDWIERLNRTCTHQLDAMRSVLSYERETARLNNTGY